MSAVLEDSLRAAITSQRELKEKLKAQIAELESVNAEKQARPSAQFLRLSIQRDKQKIEEYKKDIKYLNENLASKVSKRIEETEQKIAKAEGEIQKIEERLGSDFGDKEAIAAEIERLGKLQEEINARIAKKKRDIKERHERMMKNQLSIGKKLADEEISDEKFLNTKAGRKRSATVRDTGRNPARRHRSLSIREVTK